MERISIIIPVYNVSPYLKECIESVCRQTYRNLEMILVDDGSTDDSGTICDSYATVDQRIRVIHKPNGGLSDARNAGFSHSNGEYVFFLDSDDYLEDNAIEILYNLLKRTDADISASNFYYLYDDRKETGDPGTADRVLDQNAAMAELLRNACIKNFVWGKLYKRELLTDLPFPVGRLFEDVFWTHLVFDKAQRVAVSGSPLVYYRQRKNSISYRFHIGKTDIIDGYLERRSFVKDKYPEHLHLVDENLIVIITGLYMESARHYHIRQHRLIKKRLTEAAACLLCDGKLSEDVSREAQERFHDFYPHPSRLVIKAGVKKIFSKVK